MQLLGHCRICRAFGPLSDEHTPPRKAFNDSEIFLRRAIALNRQIALSDRSVHHKGHAPATLCVRCNSRAGRKFAASYIKLAKRIATQLDIAGFGEHLHLMAVEKPTQVLQQVLLQFASMTNEGFVEANPWLAKSVMKRQPELPSDVRLYMFAMAGRNVRSTGLIASYSSDRKSFDIFAEFAFWPIGCVLSFSDLSETYLTPIHHWADVDAKSQSTRDLVLRINRTEGMSPLDFRSNSEIAAVVPIGQTFDFPIEAAAKMQSEWLRRSGARGDEPSLAYLVAPGTRISV